MGDTASRLLHLLSLLQARQHWSGAALACRLDVTTRTVRADVERLRSLGYDIDATPGSNGGYRLRAGTRMPPLLLDDDEAVAVAVGLRTAAASGVDGVGDHAMRAVAKLEQLLPSRLRHRLSTVTAVAETVPAERDPVACDVLAAVATACHRNEQLRLDYCDRQQESTRRQVEPHRLIHVGGRWYLVAYDLDRADWRSFRLDRISPKTPTGPRFVPRELPGPDLATFVTRGRMQALWNYRARVTVHAPAETVAGRIPTGIWTVQPLDAHASQLDAGAHTAELLAAYLGALGLDFSIDPEQAPELAEAAATLARRYAAAAPRTP
ncbi:WYL domain-containing protein [Allosaccharopolyspora coralli]|uniref:WYL domain-containing protein n=1 Tax=Allosaccharopolyspora coralli TaxID=2665642 RepID=A0A5Q3Q846_9PSEU|nr:transcriptional regulator [Allosaccharopolyspora coralli]QGK70728.1 WYL domain-containing protein [Allosaccharopolyspora coralli]